MESFSSNIFKRTNYAIQAFTLLTKQYYLLSPWLEQQLTWSRFINVCGVPGGNKEMDLHMEHMNCIIKCALASNIYPNSIFCELEKSVVLLRPLLNSSMNTHIHIQQCQDLKKLVCQIYVQTQVFTEQPGRMHHSFSKMDGHLTAPQYK